MTPHFSRHEQFLRILALLEILANARQPFADDALINQLKDRLGLSRLSVRTLHRDCEFLMSCGYPLAHAPLPESRKYGWRMERTAGGDRWMPADPTTLLELVAFRIGRDLMRAFEGTVLWTGIEALRHKIERSLPQPLRGQVEATHRAFHVSGHGWSRYAARPRLLSTLATATADRRLIEVTLQPDGPAQLDGGAAGPGTATNSDSTPIPATLRLRPLRVVIRPAELHLLGLDDAGQPLLINLDRIDNVITLDGTFEPPAVDVETFLGP
jgi:hypothetical protein